MDTKPGPKTRRTYRGEDLEQRRERRRRQLLDAAKAVFGEHGFQAATVRQICAAAGLTERYFYESFDNPLDLFAAVHSRELEHLRGVLETAIADAPDEPEAAARQVINAYYGLLEADPKLTRILLIEVYGTTRDLDRLYRRGIQDFADMIRAVVGARLDASNEAGLEVGLLATALVGAAVHLAMHWYLGGYAESRETIVANCLAIFSAVNRRIGQP